MAVTGKAQPDNRTWTAKTATGKVTDDKGKPIQANSYKDAQAAARRHTHETGEYAAAVAE